MDHSLINGEIPGFQFCSSSLISELLAKVPISNERFALKERKNLLVSNPALMQSNNATCWSEGEHPQ